MAYEEKCARNRATFTRVAIDKYQLGESLRTIFDGQYGAYDLCKGTTPQKILQSL